MDRFCRTCLHSIPKDSLFFQLDGQDLSSVALLIQSQLRACIPEIRVGVIKNPVLCNHCLNDLTSAYKFKSRCLETEKQILDYILHADSDATYVDINLLIKRIANNSKHDLQKYVNDVRSRSPSLLRHGFYKQKISTSKRCKTKYKKGTEDCTIDVPIKHSNTIKKSFINNENSVGKFPKHENNLASLMSSDIKVVGPLSEFISIDDISTSIINGIKKYPLKFPQFTIKTILGECIEINDSDVEETQDSEILLPNNDDVSLPQLTVANSELNLEESNCTPDHIKTVNDVETITSTDKSPIEFETLETAIPSCDNYNNHIPLIKPESNKNINLKKSKKKHFKRHSKSKNKKIKNNHIHTTDALTKAKEICSLLVSVNDKNLSVIKTPTKSRVIEKTNSEESASSIKQLDVTQDLSAIDSSDNSNLINRTKKHLNKSEHSKLLTITVNVPISSDTSIVKDKVASPEKCSNNDPVKEEYETVEPSAEGECTAIRIEDEDPAAEDDECRAIRIKDEVIIKDECEFQHHKSKFPEIAQDDLIDKEVQSLSTENTMEVEELQPQTAEASTLQQFNHSAVLNKTFGDDFNSGPSYREARRGCYSCAVCSYSCNSESILVAHTNIHTNKNSFKYDDGIMFCGFTHDDLKRAGCITCKYAMSELFLTWLKPEVLLTKCKRKTARKRNFLFNLV